MIPRTRLAEVLGQIEELADEYGLQVANVFHAGDGNLHPLVCYDGARAGRGRARRGAGRADREGVRGRGRLDHRRARRRRGQEALHAAACSTTRPGDVPAAALRVRPRRPREPRQGHADAAAVRRGARPLPPAPARAGRRWRSASDGHAGRAASAPRAAEELPRLLAAAPSGRRVRVRGGGTKLRLGRAGSSRDVELSTAGARRDPRAQRRRPDGRARGRASRWPRAQERVRRGGPDAGARPARDGGATIGGVVAAGDSGPAAPPLRRARATSWSGMTRRAVRRHASPARRQGDQERGRLRPGEAVRRLVRHARRDRGGGGAPAPAAARHRDRGRRSDDPDALAARRRRAGARAAGAARPRRRAGRTGAGAVLARFAGAAAGPQAEARREAAAPARAGGRARRGRRRRCGTRQRDGAARGGRRRWCGCPALQTRPADVLPSRRRARRRAGGPRGARPARGCGSRPRPSRGAVAGCARALAPAPCVVLDAPAEVRARAGPVGLARGRRARADARASRSASTRPASAPRAFAVA